MICEEDENCNSYLCGGCGEGFSTICKLHSHLKTHGYFGSYYYSECTKTAYPKFQSCSISIQTDDDILGLRSKKRKLKNSIKTCNKTVKKHVLLDDIHGVEAGDRPDLCSEIKDITSIDEQKLEDDSTEHVVEEVKFDIGKSCKINNQEINLPPRKVRHADKKLCKEDTKCKKTYKTARKKLNKVNKERLTVKQVNRSNSSREKKQQLLSTQSDETNFPQIEAKKADEKFVCKLCNIDFNMRIMLRNHIQCKHLDVPFLCLFCAEMCTSEIELIEHRKVSHNLSYHKCELCEKVLSTKSMLEGHYLIHKGIKPFSCDICEPKREFTRKSQLKAHMETHSKEKTLQCEYCGKPFNARYLMLNHVKHCGGIKPYKCDLCEMKFVTNHCLQRHRRIHTGEKPFVCEICAFACSNASCLARHKRTHTGEKPFVCKHCNQCFAAPGSLKKHVRTHTQEKPYKCRYCVKAFTQNWNLKTHERQHTGETPYTCHVCGVGYKQNVLLKTHLKTHYTPNGSQAEAQSIVHISSVNHSSISPQTGSQVDCIENVPLNEEVLTQSTSQNQHQQNTVTNNVLMSCLILPSYGTN